MIGGSTSSSNGGSGGGGFGGGGQGGNNSGGGGGGGGGGSSYVAGFALPGTTVTTAGSGVNPGNSASADRVSVSTTIGVGSAGTASQSIVPNPGGGGEVFLRFQPTPAMPEPTALLLTVPCALVARRRCRKREV